MKTEIISIGTEITTGGIINTNSYYLAKGLLDLGIETNYQTSVDDNPGRLREVFETALNRVDLIITTGGLGPTEDDMTKEVLADYLGLKLLTDGEEVKHIREKFKARDKIPSNNYKQAVKIEGSRFIENSVGTAPGTFLAHGNKKIILLPGPPRELEPMFMNQVRPLLNGAKLNILTKSVNITGIGESQVEMDIKDLIHRYEDIEVATFARTQNVEIRLIGRGEDRKILEEKFQDILSEIKVRFKGNIFTYDNRPIENVVIDLLRDRGLRIGFAESCTGGLLAARLVRVSGASDVLDRAKVTYSNQAKMEELRVRGETLENFGAVSSQTAGEMLDGLLATSSIDLGISTTGLVGPNGDGTNKPVGLVYIGLGNKEKTLIKEYRLNGDRKNMQDRIVELALFNMRKFILENY